MTAGGGTMYIRSLKECEWNKDKKPEWQEFERLVRDCAAVEFGQEFHLFGRIGQNQHGIDIFSHDWKILIQCKAYTDEKELISAAKKDYDTAKAFFRENDKPIFERYIIATTLPTDGNAQKELKGIEFWFWDDICRIIDNYKFHNDNDQFVEGFEEPLFLHGDNKDVCLKNLFVPQEYRELDRNNKYGSVWNNLKERIERFICIDKHKLMIIEGDAGSGKSSLVGRLNYIAKAEGDKRYSEDETDKVRDNMFSGRPLITIRLRDLRKKLKRNEYELGDAILEYMNIPEKRIFVQHFPNAVIILDGFDELCVINGLCDYEDMITKFRGWAQDCKIIITSRPKYINVNQIKDRYIISLQHFGKEKRGEWLNKYIKLFPDGDAVDGEVAEYIRNVSSNDASAICDTPLTLYLLVGSKATFELTENMWALYHHIFTRTVVDTDYSVQMKPEAGTTHNIEPLSELIYQITEEIAYKMHCAGGEESQPDIIKTEDGKFLITEDGIKSVIKDLRENNKAFKESSNEKGITEADL
jgi:energy-coupling factor transporter ATP-binding protein EcfA2